MCDGSHLAIADNTTYTRHCVELAHSRGVELEAELAALAGDEDVSRAPDRVGDGAPMTDPGEAADFAASTGVDALAVAVGNVHGISTTGTHLDLNRLAKIADVVDVPLVLHGASGLPDDQIRAAVGLGGTKVNVNAEVRRAYLQGLRDGLGVSGEDDIRLIQVRAIAAMAAVIEDKLRMLGTHAPH